MEQLIFIGIIVLFSILEAAARKKREAGSGEQPSEPDDLPELRLPRVPRQELPSYDQDPSFDDEAAAGSRGGDASSEGLIPSDVWEEIQALARGEAPRAKVPPPPKPASEPAGASPRPRSRAPRPLPPPTGAKPTPVSTPVPVVVRGDDAVVPEHSVHLAHAKFGKPVQGRLTGFADDDGSRGALSADGKAVREVFRRGGAGLRQAVLLQEILGPPVSLKDDPSAG